MRFVRRSAENSVGFTRGLEYVGPNFVKSGVGCSPCLVPTFRGSEIAIAVVAHRHLHGEKERRQDHAAATRIGSAPVIARSPSFAINAASALSPRLPAVSNLSPVKIEFAPAMKHKA